MAEHQALFTWGAGPNSVSIAGGFNDWSATATPLIKQPDGSFKATVSVPWGSTQAYKYIVDGEWMVREDEEKDYDAAGNHNNIYTAPAGPNEPTTGTVPTGTQHFAGAKGTDGAEFASAPGAAAGAAASDQHVKDGSNTGILAGAGAAVAGAGAAAAAALGLGSDKDKNKDGIPDKDQTSVGTSQSFATHTTGTTGGVAGTEPAVSGTGVGARDLPTTTTGATGAELEKTTSGGSNTGILAGAGAAVAGAGAAAAGMLGLGGKKEEEKKEPVSGFVGGSGVPTRSFAATGAAGPGAAGLSSSDMAAVPGATGTTTTAASGAPGTTSTGATRGVPATSELEKTTSGGSNTGILAGAGAAVAGAGAAAAAVLGFGGDKDKDKDGVPDKQQLSGTAPGTTPSGTAPAAGAAGAVPPGTTPPAIPEAKASQLLAASAPGIVTEETASATSTDNESDGKTKTDAQRAREKAKKARQKAKKRAAAAGVPYDEDETTTASNSGYVTPAGVGDDDATPRQSGNYGTAAAATAAGLGAGALGAAALHNERHGSTVAQAGSFAEPSSPSRASTRAIAPDTPMGEAGVPASKAPVDATSFDASVDDRGVAATTSAAQVEREYLAAQGHPDARARELAGAGLSGDSIDNKDRLQSSHSGATTAGAALAGAGVGAAGASLLSNKDAQARGLPTDSTGAVSAVLGADPTTGAPSHPSTANFARQSGTTPKEGEVAKEGEGISGKALALGAGAAGVVGGAVLGAERWFKSASGEQLTLEEARARGIDVDRLPVHNVPAQGAPPEAAVADLQEIVDGLKTDERGVAGQSFAAQPASTAKDGSNAGLLAGAGAGLAGAGAAAAAAIGLNKGQTEPIPKAASPQDVQIHKAVSDEVAAAVPTAPATTQGWGSAQPEQKGGILAAVGLGGKQPEYETEPIPAAASPQDVRAHKALSDEVAAAVPTAPATKSGFGLAENKGLLAGAGAGLAGVAAAGAAAIGLSGRDKPETEPIPAAATTQDVRAHKAVSDEVAASVPTAPAAASGVGVGNTERGVGQSFAAQPKTDTDRNNTGILAGAGAAVAGAGAAAAAAIGLGGAKHETEPIPRDATTQDVRAHKAVSDEVASAVPTAPATASGVGAGPAPETAVGPSRSFARDTDASGNTGLLAGAGAAVAGAGAAAAAAVGLSKSQHETEPIPAGATTRDVRAHKSVSDDIAASVPTQPATTAGWGSGSEPQKGVLAGAASALGFNKAEMEPIPAGATTQDVRAHKAVTDEVAGTVPTKDATASGVGTNTTSRNTGLLAGAGAAVAGAGAAAAAAIGLSKDKDTTTAPGTAAGTGTAGSTGTSGYSGTTSTTGATDATGTTGTAGATGVTGAPGTTSTRSTTSTANIPPLTKDTDFVGLLTGRKSGLPSTSSFAAAPSGAAGATPGVAGTRDIKDPALAPDSERGASYGVGPHDPAKHSSVTPAAAGAALAAAGGAGYAAHRASQGTDANREGHAGQFGSASGPTSSARGATAPEEEGAADGTLPIPKEVGSPPTEFPTATREDPLADFASGGKPDGTESKPGEVVETAPLSEKDHVAARSSSTSGAGAAATGAGIGAATGAAASGLSRDRDTERSGVRTDTQTSPITTGAIGQSFAAERDPTNRQVSSGALSTDTFGETPEKQDRGLSGGAMAGLGAGAAALGAGAYAASRRDDKNDDSRDARGIDSGRVDNRALDNSQSFAAGTSPTQHTGLAGHTHHPGSGESYVAPRQRAGSHGHSPTSRTAALPSHTDTRSSQPQTQTGDFTRPEKSELREREKDQYRDAPKDRSSLGAAALGAGAGAAALGAGAYAASRRDDKDEPVDVNVPRTGPVTDSSGSPLTDTRALAAATGHPGSSPTRSTAALGSGGPQAQRVPSEVRDTFNVTDSAGTGHAYGTGVGGSTHKDLPDDERSGRGAALGAGALGAGAGALGASALAGRERERDAASGLGPQGQDKDRSQTGYSEKVEEYLANAPGGAQRQAQQQGGQFSDNVQSYVGQTGQHTHGDARNAPATAGQFASPPNAAKERDGLGAGAVAGAAGAAGAAALGAGAYAASRRDDDKSRSLDTTARDTSTGVTGSSVSQPSSSPTHPTGPRAMGESPYSEQHTSSASGTYQGDGKDALSGARSYAADQPRASERHTGSGVAPALGAGALGAGAGYAAGQHLNKDKEGAPAITGDPTSGFGATDVDARPGQPGQTGTGYSSTSPSDYSSGAFSSQTGQRDGKDALAGARNYSAQEQERSGDRSNLGAALGAGALGAGAGALGAHAYSSHKDKDSTAGTTTGATGPYSDKVESYLSNAPGGQQLRAREQSGQYSDKVESYLSNAPGGEQHRAREQGGQYSDKVESYLDNTGTSARQQSGQYSDNVQSYLQSGQQPHGVSPTAAGAVGAGAGALGGTAFGQRQAQDSQRDRDSGAYSTGASGTQIPSQGRQTQQFATDKDARDAQDNRDDRGPSAGALAGVGAGVAALGAGAYAASRRDNDKDVPSQQQYQQGTQLGSQSDAQRTSQQFGAQQPSSTTSQGQRGTDAISGARNLATDSSATGTQAHGPGAGTAALGGAGLGAGAVAAKDSLSGSGNLGPHAKKVEEYLVNAPGTEQRRADQTSGKYSDNVQSYLAGAPGGEQHRAEQTSGKYSDNVQSYLTSAPGTEQRRADQTSGKYSDNVQQYLGGDRDVADRNKDERSGPGAGTFAAVGAGAAALGAGAYAASRDKDQQVPGQHLQDTQQFSSQPAVGTTGALGDASRDATAARDMPSPATPGLAGVGAHGINTHPEATGAREAIPGTQHASQSHPGASTAAGGIGGAALGAGAAYAAGQHNQQGLQQQRIPSGAQDAARDAAAYGTPGAQGSTILPGTTGAAVAGIPTSSTDFARTASPGSRTAPQYPVDKNAERATDSSTSSYLKPALAAGAGAAAVAGGVMAGRELGRDKNVQEFEATDAQGRPIYAALAEERHGATTAIAGAARGQDYEERMALESTQQRGGTQTFMADEVRTSAGVTTTAMEQIERPGGVQTMIAQQDPRGEITTTLVQTGPEGTRVQTLDDPTFPPREGQMAGTPNRSISGSVDSYKTALSGDLLDDPKWHTSAQSSGVSPAALAAGAGAAGLAAAGAGAYAHSRNQQQPGQAQGQFTQPGQTGQQQFMQPGQQQQQQFMQPGQYQQQAVDHAHGQGAGGSAFIESPSSQRQTHSDAKTAGAAVLGGAAGTGLAHGSERTQPSATGASVPSTQALHSDNRTGTDRSQISSQGGLTAAELREGVQLGPESTQQAQQESGWGKTAGYGAVGVAAGAAAAGLYGATRDGDDKSGRRASNREAFVSGVPTAAKSGNFLQGTPERLSQPSAGQQAPVVHTGSSVAGGTGQFQGQSSQTQLDKPHPPHPEHKDKDHSALAAGAGAGAGAAGLAAHHHQKETSATSAGSTEPKTPTKERRRSSLFGNMFKKKDRERLQSLETDSMPADAAGAQAAARAKLDSGVPSSGTAGQPPAQGSGLPGAAVAGGALAGAAAAGAAGLAASQHAGTGALDSARTTGTGALDQGRSTGTGALDSSRNMVTGALDSGRTGLTGALDQGHTGVTGALGSARDSATGAVSGATGHHAHGPYSAKVEQYLATHPPSELASSTLNQGQTAATGAFNQGQTAATGAFDQGRSGVTGALDSGRTAATGAVGTGAAGVTGALGAGRSGATGAVDGGRTAGADATSFAQKTMDSATGLGSTLTAGTAGTVGSSTLRDRPTTPSRMTGTTAPATPAKSSQVVEHSTPGGHSTAHSTGSRKKKGFFARLKAALTGKKHE